MMHVADIEDALRDSDIRGIESAFRALVDFPHEEAIEGAETIEVLVGLLDRVIWALQLDQATMPPATCRVIAGVMSEPITTLASYAQGGEIVARHRNHWHELYRVYAQL